MKSATQQFIEQVVEEFIEGWTDEVETAESSPLRQYAVSKLRTTLATYGDAREAKGREEERERIVDLLRDYDDHQAANAVEALTPPPQTDKPESV